jgi:molybdopterin-guanine dinucleotide biosynthesis protein A
MQEVTSIILAGGRNLRLGSSKALEIIGGKSLIERVVERVKLVSTQTLIVTSPARLALPAAGEVEVLVDLYPGKGPLGGIYTGLLASPASHSIVVACDMPFLNIELLRYMIELSQDFDAVVPRLGEGMVEPLHAIYSRSCLDIMKTEIEHDHLQISHLLTMLRVRYIERAECQKFDPQLLTFFNINSRSDLDQATTLAVESRC